MFHNVALTFYVWIKTLSVTIHSKAIEKHLLFVAGCCALQGGSNVWALWIKSSSITFQTNATDHY